MYYSHVYTCNYSGIQAHSIMSSDPVKANKMYLTLAEKLMEKYVADKRAETEAGRREVIERGTD